MWRCGCGCGSGVWVWMWGGAEGVLAAWMGRRGRCERMHVSPRANAAVPVVMMSLQQIGTGSSDCGGALSGGSPQKRTRYDASTRARLSLPDTPSPRPFRCLRGRGGGVWDPTVCVPKMARSDFPNSKFHFFPRWSPWSGAGGGGGNPYPPPPAVHGHSNTFLRGEDGAT